MRVSPNLTRRTNMKHTVRYWGCGANAGAYGRYVFDTYDEAIAKYKELNKNPRIGDISID